MSDDYKQPQLPPLDQDESGYTIMSKKNLKLICQKDALYSDPQLNEKLYLQYKGFDKIQNLDEYVNLRALWLNKNAITEIENIQHLKKLNSLFLNSNALSHISGISGLENLAILDLSQNSIRKIEGLSNLPSLVTLNISHNQILNYDGLVGLLEAPTLTNIDLSFNHIEYDEKDLEIFSQMPILKVLNLKHNELQRKFSLYRKKFIGQIKHLMYLDDRPVTVNERRIIEGWLKDGKEGEERVKEQIQKEKLEKQQQELARIQEQNKKSHEDRVKYYENLKKKVDENTQKLNETIKNMIKEGKPQESIELVQKEIEDLQQELQDFRQDMETKTELINIYDQETPNYCITATHNKDGTVTIHGHKGEKREQLLKKYYTGENVIPTRTRAQQEQIDRFKQEQEERKKYIQNLVDEYDENQVENKNMENQEDQIQKKSQLDQYKEQIKRPYYGFLKEDTEKELEEVRKQQELQEIMYQRPNDLQKLQQTWIPDQDELLETLLENYMFDFQKVCRDFNKISKKVLKDKFQREYNELELRMIWTEIEKNKYRNNNNNLNKGQEDEEDLQNQKKFNILDKQEREQMLKEIKAQFEEDKEREEQLNFHLMEKKAEEMFEKMEGQKLFKNKKATELNKEFLEQKLR
ncbi:hypothetical protein PPERSA_01560 [Pseudocohnilembus persalinus]|uniref:Uncharacterized protein n=1 Tax=Pseudocohnilembus persalinus TaxID=266149 RepID=A0A0V0QHT8_PSEPJ|nr:hypothetical protein PPERSA_01560 [Pseudocohnilembus persalinus]|eukprot:KRX01690.1 hypothetical protein PPERSA_01560 [Pseudocohnilembus persalinus]